MTDDAERPLGASPEPDARELRREMLLYFVIFLLFGAAFVTIRAVLDPAILERVPGASTVDDGE